MPDDWKYGGLINFSEMLMAFIEARDEGYGDWELGDLFDIDESEDPEHEEIQPWMPAIHAAVDYFDDLGGLNTVNQVIEFLERRKTKEVMRNVDFCMERFDDDVLLYVQVGDQLLPVVGVSSWKPGYRVVFEVAQDPLRRSEDVQH